MTRPDASLIARPPIIATARREIVERHIVEQHGVDAYAERLFELVERVDLDLDLDEMADMAAHAPDRLGDAAGDGDMVVLDEHGVVEAEAMVGAAARAHRIFLERAQSGVVLRVQTMRALVCATAATSRAVAVAIPLRRLRKFSATRSAVSMPRAGPSIVATSRPARRARRPR